VIYRVAESLGAGLRPPSAVDQWLLNRTRFVGSSGRRGRHRARVGHAAEGDGQDLGTRSTGRPLRLASAPARDVCPLRGRD